jgi:hypothetical protein
MNRSLRCSLFLVAALTLALGLSGCVANRAYREMPPVPRAPAPAPGEEALCPEAPVSPPQATSAKGATKGSREIGPVLHEQVTDKQTDTVYKYSLAFVEFDDLGEMFYRPTEICKDGQGNRHGYYTELGQTLMEIARLNGGAEGPNPVFVLFIHGWKNNASESSGNVWGFRSALQSLARQYHGKRSIMGIYIGWRGAATNLPVVKEFSFWNRKNAATRIPGAHLTEAIRRITMAAKSNSNAKLVVVGHSFGGLVMERTLTQAMVEMILENKDHLDRVGSSMPDLTVLLNEAGPATESKEFLNFLYREQIVYADDTGKEHPFFLSLTSTGDWATHILFPVGQFLGKKSLNTRKYDEADEFGEKDQNNYFLHTTANSARLTNYTVTAPDSGSSPCADPYTSVTLPNVQLRKAELPKEKLRNAERSGKTYYVCKDQQPKQDTPYWAMQIPTEFVPDHSTVFKPELRALLEAFLRPHLGLPVPPAIGPAGVVPPPPPPPSSPITLQRKPASK